MTWFLATLLATLAPSAAAATPGPLAGCVDTTMTADAVSLACDGSRIVLLFSEADMPAAEHAGAASGLAQLQAERLGYVVGPSPVPLPGGKPATALPLLPGAGKAPRALFVSASTTPDHLRAAFCVTIEERADLASACAPLLGELLANGVASLTTAAASTVTVAGRTIAVPAGCMPRVDGTMTEMRCAGGVVYSAVTWPDPATRASTTGLLGAFTSGTRDKFSPDATFTDPSCRVLGGAGQCRVARANVNGVQLELLYGVGAVGDLPVTVYCLAPRVALRATSCTSLVSWD